MDLLSVQAAAAAAGAAALAAWPFLKPARLSAGQFGNANSIPNKCGIISKSSNTYFIQI